MTHLAMLLMFTLGIMGIISPYAAGPSPVYLGSGYIPADKFWKLGAIFGAIFLIALLVIAVPWLMFVMPAV
ncbi:MAG: anion permease, partial [Burkholderiaceae bacterium]